MDQSLNQLWTLSIWFMGISTTVTVGIFGWLMKIQGKISVGEDIKKDISRAVNDLDEIKVALKGNYEKKGLVSKHYDLEKRVENLEGMTNHA